MRNIAIGRKGEALAEKYLKDKGYVFVERNYKTRGSEIDLIFIEPIKVQIKELDEDIESGKVKQNLRSALIKNMENLLVFVEVKTRSSNTYGKPFEAVNNIKQKHLYIGANKFVQEYNINTQNIRFDIISIEGDKLEHIKDVF